MKAGRAALLSAVLFVLLAGPAAAVPAGLLAEAKPWHYWLAPVLTLSFVGLLVMMLVGYLVKVVMVKYGVKVGRKTS